jgi:hypothetical protein
VTAVTEQPSPVWDDVADETWIDVSPEQPMWQLQLHAVFRVGGYRTPEIDITPALGVSLIVALFALIIKTGL